LDLRDVLLYCQFVVVWECDFDVGQGSYLVGGSRLEDLSMHGRDRGMGETLGVVSAAEEDGKERK
jgi:hypothetical protein